MFNGGNLSMMAPKMPNFRKTSPSVIFNPPENEPELIFRGIDGRECEYFIQAVKRRAHADGKLRDPEWIIDLVYISLAGNALRWYMKLDKEMREDWDLLQTAMLDKWCPETNLEEGEMSPYIPTNPSIHTPPAAPVSDLAGRLSSLSLGPRTGRLRIIADDPAAGQYVARDMDSKYGIVLTCQSTTDALRVKFTPTNEPHGIQIIDPPSTMSWLGAAQSDKSKLGPGSTAYAHLAHTNHPGSSPIESSFKIATGQVQCAIWDTGCTDNNLRIIWEEGGTTYMPTIAVNVEMRQILLVTNYDAFTKNFKKNKYCRAKLVLEVC